jgi:hypothetical protein
MAFTSRKIREKLYSLFDNMVSRSSWHQSMLAMEVDNYLQQHLYTNPRYLNNKRLNIYEYSVFSQLGDDGFISEIFKRIGATNKYFVEFGVENGLECNTANLLNKGWQGLWIDGSEKFIQSIQHSFHREVAAKRLTTLNRFITSENIEALFTEGGVPKEFDILSIDIDYNDYYIWQAITHFNPRVVIIEYNATYRPDTEFTVEYDASATATNTSYFSASLRSYELLANQKGYSLVGCNFAGVNAYFVRNDLVKDLFEAPFTAENHYEPPRYFLYSKRGHRRAWRR